MVFRTIRDAPVRLMVLRQTGRVDPVLLGGPRGSTPTGGFLDYPWALRLETNSGLLMRLFIPDLGALTRLTMNGGQVHRLLGLEVLAALPRDVAVARIMHECTPRSEDEAPTQAPLVQAGDDGQGKRQRQWSRPTGALPAPGSAPPNTEHHYRVGDIATLWSIGPDSVRKIFEHEPGVLLLGNGGSQHGRRYRTILVPESVLKRVHTRLMNVG